MIFRGDWNELLRCLRLDGKLIFLGKKQFFVKDSNIGIGAGTGKLEGVSIAGLFSKRLTITGSMTGSRVDTKNMLDFAARQKVHPKINLYDKEKINEGIKLLKDGKARYRVVIKF
jgi:D-arabinose 1-dehydrogenase-like Zn-dependent alcohol dehydrogenase